MRGRPSQAFGVPGGQQETFAASKLRFSPAPVERVFSSGLFKKLSPCNKIFGSPAFPKAPAWPQKPVKHQFEYNLSFKSESKKISLGRQLPFRPDVVLPPGGKQVKIAISSDSSTPILPIQGVFGPGSTRISHCRKYSLTTTSSPWRPNWVRLCSPASGAAG